MQLVASGLIVSGVLLALTSFYLHASSPAASGARHVDAIVRAAAVDAAARPAAVVALAALPFAQPRPRPMSLLNDSATGCHPWPHMGYAADYSFTWGASFRVADEQECCEACAAHNRICSLPNSAHSPFWTASMQKGPARCGKDAVGCNLWTFCPLERCFAFDVHNHSKHECWLKHSRTHLTPAVGSGGPFPPELLAAPRKWWPWAVALSVWPWPLPEQASWTSGILAPVGAVIRPQRPRMNAMFCERHPPCPSQAHAVWPPPRE